MSLFEQTDLGRLPLQGPLACFKIGIESMESSILFLYCGGTETGFGLGVGRE